MGLPKQAQMKTCKQDACWNYLRGTTRLHEDMKTLRGYKKFGGFPKRKPLSGGENGRAGEIRTHDLLHPMQARYQATLQPELRRGQKAERPRRKQAVFSVITINAFITSQNTFCGGKNRARDLSSCPADPPNRRATSASAGIRGQSKVSLATKVVPGVGLEPTSL